MTIRNIMNTKDKVQEIVQRYGWIIPNRSRENCYTFAALIKKRYSLSNPIVFKDFNFIRNHPELYWENNQGRIKIIKI
jgi:pSer/pThr/pTyr-binding forkhead associated (FHA) protein